MSGASASILLSCGLLRVASPAVAAHNSEIPHVSATGAVLPELIEPCHSGASCAPNQVASINKGSSPAYGCTNDVNGDGLRNSCSFNSSGQYCELIAQSNGSYRKVCTAVGTGTKDAIPFPCSAGAGTCVAAAQGPTGKVLTFVAAASGTLTVHEPFAVDAGPVFLATGDFNGGHKADIAVVNAQRVEPIRRSFALDP